jgi:hypothetical protein
MAEDIYKEKRSSFGKFIFWVFLIIFIFGGIFT